MFPRIEHINDVLPYIKDREEFIVAERDDYDVVNYLISTPDTFLDPFEDGISGEESHARKIRRECRGIIFDKQGNLISRRFSKFFNLGEKEETQFSNINWLRPHKILEKLDGSMITPIRLGDNLRFGTKMGLTDVALNAEEFVAKHPEYMEFCELCDARSQTAIFEWCSRKNRIVIDYPEDRLVLLAVRNMSSGEYWNYAQLKTYADAYHLDLVKEYAGNAKTMEHLIEETKDASGIEGYVIRFDDGQMLKVKASEYVRLHRTKEDLNSEKTMLSLIINDQIDDAKAFMSDVDRALVEEFEDKFWNEIMNTVKGIHFVLCVAKAMDRKTWAINHSKSVDNYIMAIIFSCFDNDNSVEVELLNILKKNLGSSTKINNVRHLFGNLKWNYGSVE